MHLDGMLKGWKLVPTADSQVGLVSNSLSVFFKVVPGESKWNEYDNGQAFPWILFVPDALIDGPHSANRRN